MHAGSGAPGCELAAKWLAVHSDGRSTPLNAEIKKSARFNTLLIKKEFSYNVAESEQIMF